MAAPSNDKAVRWLDLELFSVWRRTSTNGTEISASTIDRLVEIAASEGRKFEGQSISQLAAAGPKEELQSRLAQLIEAFRQIPHSSFDVVGLKEQGLRVDERLGRGAMGVVHRCWQDNPGRFVAIKFIAAQGNAKVQQELDARFRDETEIIGALKHSGIAHVYFAGTVKDLSGRELMFIVMELIEGGTLQEAITTQALSLGGSIARCKLFSLICAAVQHAHKNGIFHRDIKPNNILLDDSSSDRLQCAPKLVDFGLAQIVADVTQSGPIGPSGTPGYRSPAILRGEENNPARADIFSLGMLFYRILCGAEPQGLWPADFAHLDHIASATTRCQAEAQQVGARLASGLSLPRSVASASRRLDLESILARATGSNPDAYTSVAQLSEDIARFLSGKTVTARHRNTRLLRAARWTERNAWGVSATTLGLLLIVATLLASSANNEAKQVAAVSTSQRIAARAESEREVNLDRALLFADEAVRVKDTREARNSLFNALLHHPEIKAFLHEQKGQVSAVTFSPDNAFVAATFNGADKCGIRLWDVARRAEVEGIPLEIDGGYVATLAFSRDGTILAAGYINPTKTMGGIVLWDLQTRSRLENMPLVVAEGTIPTLAFHPDGETLAAGLQRPGEQSSGCVILWNVATQTRISETPLSVDEGGVNSVTFSPDGKILAAGYDNIVGADGPGGVVLWDRATLNRLGDDPLRVIEGAVTGVAFSPDNLTCAAGYAQVPVVVAHNRGGVVLFDVAKRARKYSKAFEIEEGGVFGLAFDPDGTKLVAGYSGVAEQSDFGGLAYLAIPKPPEFIGSVPVELLPGAWPSARPPFWFKKSVVSGEGELTSVAFSPDGKSLVAGCHRLEGGLVVLCDPALPNRFVTRPLAFKKATLTGVAVQDGVLAVGVNFAFEEQPNGVMLWDLVQAAWLTDKPIEISEGEVKDISFAPGGSVLAVLYKRGQSGGVVLLDVAQRKRQREAPIKIAEGEVACVTFNHDGSLLAAGFFNRNRGSGGVVLWDMKHSTTLPNSPLTLPECYDVAIAFNPAGNTCAVGYEGPLHSGGLKLWMISAGRNCNPSPQQLTDKSVHDVQFSPDGRTLAAACTEGVEVWFLKQSSPPPSRLLPMPEGQVDCVTYLPDGNSLIAAFDSSRGSALVFWDVATCSRKVDATLPVSAHSVDVAKLISSGGFLAASHNWQNISLIDVDMESWRREARLIANRPLSTAEREQVGISSKR